MTTQKDLKRLVRRRMQKTGESYTTARARLLDHATAKKNSVPSLRADAPPASPSAPTTAAVVSPRRARASAPSRAKKPAPPASPYAKRAGMSDAAVKAATGCTWEQWVGALDYAGARDWPHRKIAEYVQRKFKVSDWWAQTVTVGYERIAGLRAVGQRRGGSFEANRSRTFPVPVATLFAAFTEPRMRGRWLSEPKLSIRKATPDRSVRMTWPDGSSVEVWFTVRGAGKSTAQIQHKKLPDARAAQRNRQFWGERLDALADWLAR